MTQLTSQTNIPYIAAAALTLFDGAAEAHRLPSASRQLLQRAAEVYQVAHQAGTEHPERLARDIVLAEPIVGLTPDQQALVAAVVALQREKQRRQREPALLRLGAADQSLALRLAALLHLALALAAEPPGALQVEVLGAQALLLIDRDDPALLARLEEAATRWRKVVGEIRIGVGGPPLPDEQPQGERPAELIDLALVPLVGQPPLTLRGDEPLAEGARRMLRHLFDKLLAREDRVREADHPEDVHQMRVAARKLRASLQIVEPIYAPRRLRAFRRKLRRLAQVLGALRDYDVFGADVQAYRTSLPPEQQASLQPLLTAIEERRARSRAALLDAFDAGRYDRFKQEFARFLTSPGAHVEAEPIADHAPRVRDMAGSLIWRRYEQWRAYEMALPTSSDAVLHEARIAGKRLRYALEFFDEALGSRVDSLLEPLVSLQETLGQLQDGVTARTSIAALGLIDDPGAQSYLAARTADHSTVLAKLPSVWDKVDSATYRRRLFELIAKL